MTCYRLPLIPTHGNCLPPRQPYTTTDREVHMPYRERLMEIIDRHDLAGIALCASENVTAFAGVHLITQTIVPDRLAFFVANNAGEEAVIVSDIEELLTRAQSSVEDVRVYVEFIDRPATFAAAVLEELGAA